MARSAGKKLPLRGVTMLVIALLIWGWDKYQKNHGVDGLPGPPVITRGEAPPTAEASPTRAEKQGNYEVYRSCKLSSEKHNDGDSFEVALPDGRRETFRLYFVDTPESAFKSYPGGDTNHQRIREQAVALGGITPEQAVEIGQQAKSYILTLLAKQPFVLYTVWDSPFNDRRYHAFIEVQDNGRPRWLHELLVERGFCRIHTKGANLPDGTPMSRHKDQLYALEREAKARRAGAWGLR